MTTLPQIAAGISREDILQSMVDFTNGAEHPFGPSTTYDLVHDGSRYPPKAIFGLAARRTAGRMLTPNEFGAGDASVCFRTLRKLGFEVQPKEAKDVRDVWHEMQGDPVHRFRLALRNFRCVELRTLLLENVALSLERFNEEVWAFEKRTFLSGHDITGEVWSKELTADRAAELHEALNARQIELHGNYLWKSGTGIYAPFIADGTERANNVARALAILREATLSPEEKVRQLRLIKGFGRNIATGLVMVVHPNQFAIYNSVSEHAIKELGYPANDLATFQESVKALAEQLGTQDFVTLDYFLYARTGEDIVELDRPATWLFQANPKKWSFTEHLDEVRQMETDTWTGLPHVSWALAWVN